MHGQQNTEYPLSGWLVAVPKQKGRVYSYISIRADNKDELNITH